MTCKPLNLQVPSTSYTSFNLQPPRTPGRRSFPSVQVITRPLALILFTIIRQCTNPREVIYLIHPRSNNLASLHERSSKFITEKILAEQSGPTIVITEEKVL
ncbi:hypothetical protein GJ744_003883 [Endocarpon pusillum]|uniref:Uncharacterized protein n=1 Tax=Endocarpon pusillum TaxID=364733 RepID=A0A8H7A683_9EURO|nr:hypothetical protein GJ744_003883 [Endocarpon pusillum]